MWRSAISDVHAADAAGAGLRASRPHRSNTRGPVVSPLCFQQPHLPHGLMAGVALPPTGDQGKALARQHLIRPPELGRFRGACGVSPPPGGDHLAPLVSRRGGDQQPDGAGGVCRASQIDMRPRETGAFLAICTRLSSPTRSGTTAPPGACGPSRKLSGSISRRGMLPMRPRATTGRTS